jgi:hypothetical protein
MDRDWVRFIAWRHRQALIGAGILFALLAAVGLGFWAGHAGSAAATGARPLAEALRAAEAALPSMSDSGLDLGTAQAVERYATVTMREQRKLLECETYRKVLRVGEPVVFGGACAELSCQVASKLRPGERENWLRACLEVAKRPRGVPKQLKEIEERCAVERATRILCGDEPYSTLEAIYNLSADANLRLDAKRAFDSFAAERFDKDLSLWESFRDDPNSTPWPHPRQRQIADWGQGTRGAP